MKEIRLAYFSKPSDTFRFIDLEPVLASARVNNDRYGVTGLLGLTSTHFIHYLEGQREAVSQTISRVVYDRRHRDLTFYAVTEIDQRLMPDDPLAFIGAQVFTEDFCMSLFGRKNFIPSLLTDKTVMALIKALSDNREGMSRSEELLREALEDDYFEISF